MHRVSAPTSPGGLIGNAVAPTNVFNLAANVPPGVQPFGVDFLEDLNRAYVGNYTSNSVTVISDNILINPAITQ